MLFIFKIALVLQNANTVIKLPAAPKKLPLLFQKCEVIKAAVAG